MACQGGLAADAVCLVGKGPNRSVYAGGKLPYAWATYNTPRAREVAGAKCKATWLFH
jgi:hypothetical protein